MSDELRHAGVIQDRLTDVLNGSGKFSVEASEIDGLTDVRLLVTDLESGEAFTLIAETGLHDG